MPVRFIYLIPDGWIIPTFGPRVDILRARYNMDEFGIVLRHKPQYFGQCRTLASTTIWCCFPGELTGSAVLATLAAGGDARPRRSGGCECGNGQHRRASPPAGGAHGSSSGRSGRAVESWSRTGCYPAIRNIDGR
jgi:hypothetical protein